MKRLLLATLFGLACASACAADASAPSKAISEVTGSVVLGSIAVVGVTGSVVVDSVTAVGDGIDVVLECAGQASRATVRLSGEAARGLAIGAGTVLQVAATSGLFNEGLGNFFLDDMFLYEAQLVIPSPDVQARLARVLSTSTPRRLHHNSYNMLSYAYSTRYQNSNQWVLETLAAASAPPGAVETRAEAQSWLKGQGYRVPTVEIPAVTRLGARMFRANVAFDDHPFDRRMAGQIDTVTTEAVVGFVRGRDPQARVLVVE